MKNIFMALGIALFLTACNKTNESSYDQNTKGELSVEFDNIAGSSDLQLNTGTYANPAGESIRISKFKYYVSNFVFTRADGSIYTVPQDSCYFLIDELVADSRTPKFRLPEGEYKSLKFLVGVDSLRNTMDVSKRTGALDITTSAADLYWGWNSGYIFLKLEGSSGATNFQYHIGGFGGYSTVTPNNLRTITLDLSARGNAKVKAARASNIHLFVDAMKLFGGTANVSVANLQMVHSAAGGINLANNSASMFRHDHTEN